MDFKTMQGLYYAILHLNLYFKFRGLWIEASFAKGLGRDPGYSKIGAFVFKSENGENILIKKFEIVSSMPEDQIYAIYEGIRSYRFGFEDITVIKK